MGFLNYCKEIHGDTSAQVTLLDINPKMLEVGKQRFLKTPYLNSKYFILYIYYYYFLFEFEILKFYFNSIASVIRSRKRGRSFFNSIKFV
jgi:ubiquinone/menaquinone biosynthesis C-methylase UbiE